VKELKEKDFKTYYEMEAAWEQSLGDVSNLTEKEYMDRVRSSSRPSVSREGFLERVRLVMDEGLSIEAMMDEMERLDQPVLRLEVWVTSVTIHVVNQSTDVVHISKEVRERYPHKHMFWYALCEKLAVARWTPDPVKYKYRSRMELKKRQKKLWENELRRKWEAELKASHS
jgi:hypothetical protein